MDVSRYRDWSVQKLRDDTEGWGLKVAHIIENFKILYVQNMLHSVRGNFMKVIGYFSTPVEI